MSTSVSSNSSTQQISVKPKFQKMLGGDGKIKAFASVTINGTFAVHGLKIMDGEKGLFVAMPSSSYKSGDTTKYQEIFHPVTAEARKMLMDAVLNAYKQALAEQQNESQKQSGNEEAQEDEVPDMTQSM